MKTRYVIKDIVTNIVQGLISLPNTIALSFADSTVSGLTVNRLTQVEIDDLTPTDGDLVYNLTTTKFNLRENGAWSVLSGTTPKRETFVLTAGQITAKQVVLAGTPISASVWIGLDSAPHQGRGTSWDFTGPNIITWNGFSLDGVLQAGLTLEVFYVE